MTGRRLAVLGFALSWVSSLAALVVCVVAWRQHPGARGWAVAGAVSAVVQLVTLAMMVRFAAAFATEPQPATEVALGLATPLVLGWGSFAVVLMFTA